MNRDIRFVPVNEFDKHYVVKITGETCPPPPSQQARAQLFQLLKTCVDTPSMLDCGNNTAEKIRVYHDGNNWVIVVEAVGP